MKSSLKTVAQQVNILLHFHALRTRIEHTPKVANRDWCWQYDVAKAFYCSSNQRCGVNAKFKCAVRKQADRTWILFLCAGTNTASKFYTTFINWVWCARVCKRILFPKFRAYHLLVSCCVNACHCEDDINIHSYWLFSSCRLFLFSKGYIMLF